MALYVHGITVAQSGAAVGGIEQVAVLPAVGATDHLYFLTVADDTHEVGLYYFDGTVWHSTGSGGGSGTDDYNDLNNKPSINGITLQGNKSLTQLNIASIDTTYTRTKVDELISASQKVYLQSTPPTYLSNVGLYYVGSSTSTNYDIYLVDSTKQVTNLGTAGISLTGYQKEVDSRLYWTPTSTVVDSINDLKYRLDTLPSGGTITMNGVITGSPTFYAPTTSGVFGQKLVSYGPGQPPQWVTETGESGTKVMLNGGTTAVAEAHIYVPSVSGTAGDVLKSQGPYLPPIWETPGSESGPTMVLNGTVKDVTAANVNIYAPITSGSNGYILKSKGPGLAPQWEAPGAGDGTYMKLNGTGTEVTIDKVDIYAPTASGSTGQLLLSNGETSSPQWLEDGEEDQVLVSKGAGKSPVWQAFSGIPTGVIMPFAGLVFPDGWLLCDGRAVSRTDYADLFAVIGTLYGEGDKVTTFNLPNLVGKFLEGAVQTTTGHVLGSSVAAALPTPALETNTQTHSHSFTGTRAQTEEGGSHYHSWSQKTTNKSGTDTQTVFSSSENRGSATMTTNTTGAHKHYYTPSGSISGNGSHSHTVSLSSSNTIYGKSTTVQPASVCVNYLIKA